MGAFVSLGAAALIPWEVQDQAQAAFLIAVLSIIPMLVLGDLQAALMPFVLSACGLSASVYFAGQNQRHRQQARQALEAFQENLRRMQMITEHIKGVLWLSDVGGAPLYVSPRFEETWGFSRECLHERAEAWLDAVHPDDRVMAAAWFRRIESKSGETCEYRLVHPDGSLRSEFLISATKRLRIPRVVGFCDEPDVIHR